jgi:superfamily II DNA/RNA helicase
MTQPTHIRALDPHDDNATVDAIEQHVWRAHSLDKQELIARALQADGRGLTIIFCRTKRNAQRVSDDLADRGFAAAAVHGDLGQGAREQALRAFRNGKVDVLVATDVAARGIHVDDVDLVVHFDPPNDHKDYLHRSGRTARAGNDGTVVALVHSDQLSAFRRLHADANVNATIETVKPGHPAVRAVAESGDPIVVRELPPARQASRRPPRRIGADNTGSGAEVGSRSGSRTSRPRRRSGPSGPSRQDS